jgi:starch synthase
MKILFITSEATPLAKVGGLADVAGSLPKALRARGHDVRILLPQYGCLDLRRFPLTSLKTDFHFSLPGESASINLNRTESQGVPVYLLENAQYFGGPDVYNANDLERFYFYSQAVFEILPHLDWQPEIIHCHDWLTSLVVMWSKKAGYPWSSVFTIHNLAYQGFFDENYMNRRDLKKDWDYFPPGAPQPPRSFMAQGILCADLVSTVSETYAQEITTPEYGVGLDALLRYRQDSLTGIVNGLDYQDWNPLTDDYLPVNFDSSTLKKRILNKFALQKVAGLPVDRDSLLIGMVQRLDEQKGLDILAPAIEPVLKETGAQLVILGRGRDNYENMLRQIGSLYPRQVGIFIAFEEPLARLIYGGCDAFLMPSRFEPCGLGQLIAMRYGALPIVRHTGGLVDTVPEFNADLSQGNGFIFHGYSPEALTMAVKEASAAFRRQDLWIKAMQRISRLDFSWQSSAQKYETAYSSVLAKSVK